MLSDSFAKGSSKLIKGFIRQIFFFKQPQLY